MRGVRFCIIAAAVTALLFLLNLLCGSISIPTTEVLRILMGRHTTHDSWRFIILETRLPQAITATLCGGALAVSGLMLQTAFKNPLAGPSIFGISGGAGLGVALVMLLLGGSVTAGTFEATGFAAILLGAFLGAMAVTTIIFPRPPILCRVVSRKVSTMICAFWLMLYGCSLSYLRMILVARLSGSSGFSGVFLAILKQVA